MENIGDEAEIVNAVEKQLWDYTYTFPNALNVRTYLTLSPV